MKYEAFKALCERFKWTGETWTNTWKHISSIRIADVNEIDIQALIHKKMIWFTGDGNEFDTGFIVLEPESPLVGVEKSNKSISFISIDSLVSISFIDEHECENIEKAIYTYFSESVSGIDYTLAFSSSLYNVYTDSKGIATYNDVFTKSGVSLRINDPIATVTYYYLTSAERDAASYANPGAGVKILKNADVRTFNSGTTLYLRAFGNIYGTTPVHADANIVIH